MRFFKKKTVSIVTPLVISDTTNENIQQEHGSRPVSAHSRVSHHAVNLPISEQMMVPQKANCCTKESLKEQALLIATIVAVVLGAAVGIALRGLKCPGSKMIELDYRIFYHLSFDYRRSY
jgi:hypothetical protein